MIIIHELTWPWRILHITALKCHMWGLLHSISCPICVKQAANMDHQVGLKLDALQEGFKISQCQRTTQRNPSYTKAARRKYYAHPFHHLLVLSWAKLLAVDGGHGKQEQQACRGHEVRGTRWSDAFYCARPINNRMNLVQRGSNVQR